MSRDSPDRLTLTDETSAACLRVRVSSHARLARAPSPGGIVALSSTRATPSATSTPWEGSVVPAGMALETAVSRAGRGPATRPVSRWEARRLVGYQRGSGTRSVPSVVGKYRCASVYEAVRAAWLMRIMLSGASIRHCPSSRTSVRLRVTTEAFERVSTPVASMLATPRTETVTSACAAFSVPALTEGAVSVS